MSPETKLAVEVDGRTLSLSNLDKVLYPEVGFTKGEVLDYYTRIAPVLLPHLQGRALTFKRYPDGVDLFAKTSGSKGMQVSAPIQVDDPDLPSRYAHTVAKRLESARPDLIVSRMTKSLRAGKIFVDWSQNNPAKTTVAPYSLRARDEPTVSTPLTWDEVETGGMLKFTSDEVLERVDEYGDLFAGTLDTADRTRITPSMATGE